MARDISLYSGRLVARGLKVSRVTSTLVGVTTAGVALSAGLAMQFLGFAGQGTMIAVVFITLALGAATLSLDVYSRSSLVVSNFRSMGATSGSLSFAMMVSVLAYGAAGSAIGGTLGAALGASFGRSGIGAGPLISALAVTISSCAAIVAGTYGGTRISWRS